jgi:hypothetical protein
MAASSPLHKIHVMRQLMDAGLDDLDVLPAFREYPEVVVVPPVIAVPGLQLLPQVLYIEAFVLRQFRVISICIVNKVVQYVFEFQYLSPRLIIPVLFHCL